MAFLLKFLSMLPLPMLRSLARLVAYVINQNGDKGLRWTVRVNSYVAYPSLSREERNAFEVACVKNQCLSAVESLKSWGMPPQYSIDQIHTIHNQELLTQALENPKGMIAIVPHLGTWEIMNAWLNQFGSPTIMFKPMKQQSINEFVLKGRERMNATLVPTDATGVKSIFKALKNGEFTIILPDHTPDPSGGEFAPFFGEQTLTSTLTCKLASKTGCAMIGLSCIRREDGDGFDIYCDDVTDPDIWSRNMATATQALNKQIEQMIGREPSHYIWGYRRFRASKNFHSLYQWQEDELIDYFVNNNRHNQYTVETTD